MPRETLAISACLLGDACRYDGNSQPCEAALALACSYELVPICPEQLGGLPTPRIPSELQPDGHVVDRDGNDRTAAFHAGARAALAIARERGCKCAVLKSRSPSCGVHEVYDGSFKGVLVPGRGVAAALFAESGIDVLDENDL